MATPPPLYPSSKKNGCYSGCLKVAALGIGAFIFLSVAGKLLSDMQWRKNRTTIIRAVGQAVRAGDHATALDLLDRHKSRNDPDLKALIPVAENLRRSAAQRTREEKIEPLIEEIKNAEGDVRRAKIERLLLIVPNTKEFPEEVAAIRQNAQKREQEYRAKSEADSRAELERKEKARKEEARLALEARQAEYKWRYRVSEDKLTSKPAYHAWVKSINEVNFDFPYQGAQSGELLLRTHPQYGKDLIVRVEKGQMLVHSYEDTTIKVVFDAGSPISYKVTGAADHSSNSLFLRDYHSFVERMLKATKVKISVPFYQEGDVVFEFDVSQFNADKYIGKNPNAQR